MEKNYLKEEFQQQLLQNQHVFDIMQRFPSQGFCFWDLDSPEHIWFSQSFWNQLIIKDTKETTATRFWKEIIHPEDFKACQDLVKQGSFSAESIQKLWRFKGQKGEWKTYQVNLFPVKGDAGKVSRFFGILNHSFENQNADFQAERSNRLLRKVLMNLGDLVMVLDSGFVVKEFYANETHAAFLKEVPGDIVGKTIRDIMLPQDFLYHLMEACQEARMENISVGLQYQLDLDDETEYFNGTVSALKNDQNQLVEFIFTSRNVTTKVKADNRLKELALVASKTSDLIFITDSLGQITWANHAFESKMEFSLYEILGKKPSDLFFKHESAQETRNKLNEAIKKRSSAHATLLNYTKSGIPIWMEISMDPVFNEVGHCSHFIVIGRDISQRVESTRELEKTREILLETNRVAKIGSWEYDVATDKVFWSDVTKEIHEVPADFEPKVKEVLEFYKEGPSRQRYFEVAMMAFQEGKDYDEEFQIVTAKGNEAWVRTIGRVEMNEGKVVRLYGTFQNIDVFKEAESKVKKSASLLENLANQVPGALYEYVLLDSGHAYFPFVSSGIEKITGVTPKEVKANSNILNEMIHPDDIERVNRAIATSYETLERWEEYFRVITKSGEVVHLKGISNPEKIEDGVVWYGFLMATSE